MCEFSGQSVAVRHCYRTWTDRRAHGRVRHGAGAVWDTMITTIHDGHEALSAGSAEIGQPAQIQVPNSIVRIVDREGA